MRDDRSTASPVKVGVPEVSRSSGRLNNICEGGDKSVVKGHGLSNSEASVAKGPFMLWGTLISDTVIFTGIVSSGCTYFARFSG
jgi:hypothetical protein